jgi:hypothetical protein
MRLFTPPSGAYVIVGKTNATVSYQVKHLTNTVIEHVFAAGDEFVLALTLNNAGIREATLHSRSLAPQAPLTRISSLEGWVEFIEPAGFAYIHACHNALADVTDVLTRIVNGGVPETHVGLQLWLGGGAMLQQTQLHNLFGPAAPAPDSSNTVAPPTANSIVTNAHHHDGQRWIPVEVPQPLAVDLDLGGHVVGNIADATSAQDATSLSQVGDLIQTYNTNLVAGKYVPILPGGTEHQVMVKTGTGDQMVWATMNEVPKGGGIDQVLTKTSNTDHDLKWSTRPEFLPTITTPASGHLLQYDGTKWVNNPAIPDRLGSLEAQVASLRILVASQVPKPTTIKLTPDSFPYSHTRRPYADVVIDFWNRWAHPIFFIPFDDAENSTNQWMLLRSDLDLGANVKVTAATDSWFMWNQAAMEWFGSNVNDVGFKVDAASLPAVNTLLNRCHKQTYKDHTTTTAELNGGFKFSYYFPRVHCRQYWITNCGFSMIASSPMTGGSIEVSRA